ncbi:putative DNA-directed dna polymerase protein [Coleophoma cylindrospora]|uniref:Putative DNA-directed dna polymerase protein n=1 Tax=Coleophoma cylindrospora TaxID=1849047 RepID=A0A3D8SF96_9HELO|nr:putative DNA-directed dna polymerase protein [Coleophoma cylindrospora]
MASRKESSVGHKTTVNGPLAVKNTTTAVVSAARHKRPFSELLQNDRLVPTNEVSTFRRHFQRPSLTETRPQILKASEVCDCENNCRPQDPATDYSQRKKLQLTPTPASDPLLHLSHPCYNLLPGLVQNFVNLGIHSIYPWQSKCLRGRGLLNGKRNLVYSAPTGGGKSLVADVLMLKTVIENPEKKAILVLPYVALVQEKTRWLRRAVEGIQKKQSDVVNNQQHSLWRKRGDENSVRVVGFFGGSRSTANWTDMDIAVCTIEKANSLINTAIDDCTVSNLGVVVIDELHMIDDDHRGYLLELLGTKLLSLEQKVQIIGMSATLQNPEILAQWLNNALYYESKYRPVPVEEHLVFDNTVYAAASSSSFYKTATQLQLTQSKTAAQAVPAPLRIIKYSEHSELKNPLINAVVALANETARAGYGALVFCSSRTGCETDALLISQVLPRGEEVSQDLMRERRDLMHDLRSSSTGLDPVLEKTIPYGVGFHHAGLTIEERDIVATAYDNGIIKVIVATCSLAAGINLPARRVILHGARMGADLVGPAMLRQMRGRAGRKGKDEIGETYLCCQKSDLEAVATLMEAEIPVIESCLLPGKRGLKRALLEVIATRLATSAGSVDDYIKKTLLYHSIHGDELSDMVKSTLKELSADGLITNDCGSEFEATTLGLAVTASSLGPEDGLFVNRELKKALRAFVMDGDLHVLYTFTPVQVTQSKVDWQVFRKEMDHLDESSLRVMSFVGVKPSLVNKMAQGGIMKEGSLADEEVARIYKRFYTALQLRDLCNEMPIHAVARKYDLPRGSVQNLAQTCHGFAAGMIKFCERMGWAALGAVLDHFSDRLKAGAKADLLALAEITYVKSRTARIFWDNGYKNVGAVAAADIKELLPVLLMAQPKKPRLDAAEEEQYHQKLLLKAEIISKSANRVWDRMMQAEVEEE